MNPEERAPSRTKKVLQVLYCSTVVTLAPGNPVIVKKTNSESAEVNMLKLHVDRAGCETRPISLLNVFVPFFWLAWTCTKHEK